MERIVKWFYRGKVFGYQVDVEQDQYRFNDKDQGWGLAFTVQWDFLGQGSIFHETFSDWKLATEKGFYTYDLGTAIGVIGGYIFFAVQLYK